MARITRDFIHIGMHRTSLLPLRIRFTVGSYFTNASGQTFAAEGLANDSSIPCTSSYPSICQEVYVRFVLRLVGHVVGHCEGHCFITTVGLDDMSCIIHPFPSLCAFCT